MMLETKRLLIRNFKQSEEWISTRGMQNYGQGIGRLETRLWSGGCV